MAMRGDKGRNKVKGRIGPALYSVMEPGDDVLAGVLAESGPGPRFDLLAGLASVGLAIVSLYDLSGPGLNRVAGLDLSAVSFIGWLVTALISVARKPVFIAVTQRSLICYRVSRLDHSPVRLLFRGPPSSVRITGSGRGLLRSSVRYTGPGAGEHGLRLTIRRPWRCDLEAVLTTLQLAGAAVDVASRDAILPQLPQVTPPSRT
jgi:hypothetical protein